MRGGLLSRGRFVKRLSALCILFWAGCAQAVAGDSHRHLRLTGTEGRGTVLCHKDLLQCSAGLNLIFYVESDSFVHIIGGASFTINDSPHQQVWTSYSHCTRQNVDLTRLYCIH